MLINFTKMHGLGNDFMVIDGIRQKIFLNKENIVKLADRNRGVGFDQLLLVEAPYDPDLDFHYRIFNADGSEVQMCGNGARCFARFVLEHGLCNKDKIKVSTMNGVLELIINQDCSISVDMGAPIFDPPQIPALFAQEQDFYELEVNGKTYQCGSVSMGNPHVVLIVEDLNDELVSTLGPLIESHALFPERVNVGFMRVISSHEADLRVYERGCGETLACGSGACAAFAVGVRQQCLEQEAKINLPGGSLKISYKDDHIILRGPATTVYEGCMEI